MPELKELEANAVSSADKWKNLVEDEAFSKVYVRKTKQEREAMLEVERARADSLDDEDQCTVEPPQI